MGEAILAVGAGERPASFEQFSAAIDPAWIAAALTATGTASVRRRKLPAEHVVWLVIGRTTTIATASTTALAEIHAAALSAREHGEHDLRSTIGWWNRS